MLVHLSSTNTQFVCHERINQKIYIFLLQNRKDNSVGGFPPAPSSVHLGALNDVPVLSGCVFFPHIIPPFLWRDESYSGDLIAVV